MASGGTGKLDNYTIDCDIEVSRSVELRIKCCPQAAQVRSPEIDRSLHYKSYKDAPVSCSLLVRTCYIDLKTFEAALASLDMISSQCYHRSKFHL